MQWYHFLSRISGSGSKYNGSLASVVPALCQESTNQVPSARDNGSLASVVPALCQESTDQVPSARDSGSLGAVVSVPQPSSADSNCCGFVLVTDNIHKNIRPSYQREHRQTQSLHTAILVQ
ncbi:uncharacterized protein [Dysidea avara]|uniref:uncharacterized protein n=1 Tax=Dysidea avara TaxID=196820 RepID=UPI00332A9A0D